MKTELEETTVILSTDDNILFNIKVQDNKYSGLNEDLRVSFKELIAIHDLIEKMIVK